MKLLWLPVGKCSVLISEMQNYGNGRQDPKTVPRMCLTPFLGLDEGRIRYYQRSQLSGGS